MPRLSTDLDADTHRALKQVALDHDLRQTDLVRAAVALITTDPNVRDRVVEHANQENPEGA